MNSVDRVQKLLALSTSPVEPEARSAAYAAAKIIIAEKMTFMVAPPPPFDSWDDVLAKARKGKNGDTEELRRIKNELSRLRNEFVFTQSDRDRLRSENKRLAGECDRMRNMIRVMEQPPPAKPATGNIVPKRIRAKYEAMCAHCGAYITDGDSAMWAKGVGITHATSDCMLFWGDK